MAGKRIEDHQVTKYKRLRTKHGQEVAAAKVGISVASARRIEGARALPSQRPPRSWRTRSDPFEEVWEAELVPLLEAQPRLTAMTLLEEVQRRHPGQYEDNLLRTLQRRVRAWCARFGADREVYFAQMHPPGRLGLSDFTHAAVLQVTIAGALLVHLLYQFALAYSGWRYVEVVLSGESFAALSSGLQNALWMMGGVPEEHRTDSLSAAFNNRAEQEDLTKRYEGLCEHYGMRPSRNNLGVSHENGSIEARQGTLKRTMEQALLLRGHRDFADLEAYRRFVAEVMGRMNARVERQFREERGLLRALPVRRSSEYEEVDARVTKFSTLTVKRVLYTVPSRLVGHRLKVRVTSRAAGRLAGWRVRPGTAPRAAWGGEPARQGGGLPAPAACAQAQARGVCAVGAPRRAVPALGIPADVGTAEGSTDGSRGLQGDRGPAGPGGQRRLRGAARTALGWTVGQWRAAGPGSPQGGLGATACAVSRGQCRVARPCEL